jgi:tripartite-type tricarboxylate transporter receptor subunit TctC
VIVENMPGAGSLIGANYLYKVAAPDGLTAGTFVSSLLLQQVAGDPTIEFDAPKFSWIGAPSSDNYVLVARAERGIKTFQELMASPTELIVGVTGTVNPLDVYARVVKQYIGPPMRLVGGYAGTVPVRAALETGELDSYFGSWSSLRLTDAEALQAGSLIPLIQVDRSREAPEAPLIVDQAKTDEGKQLARVVAAVDRATRFLVAPPGVPAERLKILRDAYTASLKDPALLAEAARANAELTPVSGEQVEAHVKETFSASPRVVELLKELLKSS